MIFHTHTAIYIPSISTATTYFIHSNSTITFFPLYNTWFLVMGNTSIITICKRYKYNWWNTVATQLCREIYSVYNTAIWSRERGARLAVAGEELAWWCVWSWVRIAWLSGCLFRLLAASGHQKLLQTAKRSAFQSVFIKFVGTKTIQNQYKHIIGWVVVVVGIRHFLDLEFYQQFYLSPHVIVMILKFSPQPDTSHSQIFRKAGQKKSWNQTGGPVLYVGWSAARQRHHVHTKPRSISPPHLPFSFIYKTRQSFIKPDKRNTQNIFKLH
jgi:hypothetical protein